MASNQFVTVNFHGLSNSSGIVSRVHLSHAEQKRNERKPEPQPKPKPQPTDTGTVVTGCVSLRAGTDNTRRRIRQMNGLTDAESVSHVFRKHLTRWPCSSMER